MLRVLPLDGQPLLITTSEAQVGSDVYVHDLEEDDEDDEISGVKGERKGLWDEVW